MRITIEIDEKTVHAIQTNTGIAKKSPAIAKVLHDYCRETRKKQFLAKVIAGRTDYAVSNEQLEKAGAYDAN
jgi:hypothetical protein